MSEDVLAKLPKLLRKSQMASLQSFVDYRVLSPEELHEIGKCMAVCAAEEIVSGK